MEPRANHVVIGVITLALVVSMAAFGLWLVRFGSERETLSYDVVFREAVSGLTEGSRVEYNGLRVGTVNDLRIDADDPSQVVARISVSSDTPVTTDTQARLAMTNITGAMHIQLSTDSLAAPSLTSATQEEVPVIIAEPSPFARLATNWEETITGVNTLIANLNQVLSEENAQSVASILNNVEEISGFVVRQQHEFEEITGVFSQAGESASEALNSLDALVGELGLVLDEHSEPILRGAAGVMARIEQVAGQVQRLLSDNQAALDQGLRGMQGIEPAIRDFRSAIDTVERGARQFDEDPQGYLMGGERLPEFEP